MNELSPAQRHQILVEWHDTRPYDDFKLGLHHLVRARALRHGDRLAVEDGHQRLTLREVVYRASGLAGLLRRAGIGHEDLVALHLLPSAAITWTALGILEVGAACLPLDPRAPTKYRRQVLRNASPRAILYADALAEKLVGEGCLQVDIRTVEPLASPLPLTDPEFSPTRLAYVLVPSPGHGKVLGERLSHRALTNLELWYQYLHQLRPGSFTTLPENLGSATAVAAIWASLVRGFPLQMTPMAASGNEDGNFFNRS